MFILQLNIIITEPQNWSDTTGKKVLNEIYTTTFLKIYYDSMTVAAGTVLCEDVIGKVV